MFYTRSSPDIDYGQRFMRAYSGGERASATVLAILAAPDGRPHVSLRCHCSTGGGILGMGGAGSGLILGWPALWQSGESLVRSNLDKIAGSINRELGKSVEEGQRLAARRPSKVDSGELRYRTQLFLDRPPENWSLKDAASVLATFMTQTSGNIVGGPPGTRQGCAHALVDAASASRSPPRARTAGARPGIHVGSSVHFRLRRRFAA